MKSPRSGHGEAFTPQSVSLAATQSAVCDGLFQLSFLIPDFISWHVLCSHHCSPAVSEAGTGAWGGGCLEARLSQLTSREGSTEVWLWLSAFQSPSEPTQLADFCFRSVSCAGKESPTGFLGTSFKPETTDILFICLCAQPGPPLFLLNSGYFDVIKKNRLGREGNILNLILFPGLIPVM